MKAKERILLIPDMHAPYEHKDAINFLKAVKDKYKPTRVINLGDEIDAHAMSFHPSDPDLPSAGDELKLAIKHLRPLYKLFPKMDLVHSNHGSMGLRKAKHYGIPVKYLRHIGDILEAPQTWEWHADLKVPLIDGSTLWIAHGIKKKAIDVAKHYGMHHACGHFHTEFRIEYISSPDKLIWSVNSGCLIDRHALAFEYDKVNAMRPILGCTMIIDGYPQLIPMKLNKRGRWTGDL